MHSIPIVDFGTDKASLFEQFREHGFAQLVNHGISDELIGAVWQQSEAFFALPMEEKRKLSRSHKNVMGYYDRELTKEKRDQKEVFDFICVPHPELPDNHPDNFSKVDGVNQWSEGQPPEFQLTMKAYAAACTDLSHRILSVFSLGLGLEQDYFRQYFDPAHTSFTRLNHYPTTDVLESGVQGDVVPLGDQALHHHTDAGVLTVLLQDAVGGLQAKSGDDWINVEPIDGSLIINVGDLMQIWSNDKIKSALHRVRPITQTGRYSIPFFFNPPYETVCAPILAPGEDALYRPMKWGDFRAGRAEGDFGSYGQEIQISDFRL